MVFFTEMVFTKAFVVIPVWFFNWDEDLPAVHGDDAADKGLSLKVVSIRRDAVDATSHEIKSLNYVNSILAKIEAADYGADEAIMLDARGFVSESTICNVFA